MTPSSRSGARPGGDAAAGRLAIINALVDEASMESFPASDAPSYWARNANEVKTTGETHWEEPGHEEEARWPKPT